MASPGRPGGAPAQCKALPKQGFRTPAMASNAFRSARKFPDSTTMAEHFSLRLTASRMLAPSVRHLEFERADGAPFAFIPGQFLQVHFHYADGKPTKRSYSVATIGGGDGAPVQRIEI